MLWKLREFRRLRNLIDKLPSTSHFSAAMANDEEYIRNLVAKYGDFPNSKSAGPPLTEWTREVSMLATIADLLKSLNSTLIAVNLEKGKKPPAVEPEERPTTVITRIRLELRLDKHRSLARRLLGDRASN